MEDLPSPFHRYRTQTNLSGSATAPLLDFVQFGETYFVVEGLDLLNFDLAVGARALVSVNGTGPSSFSSQLFQGIVYATSQAVFSWRGSMVVFPNETMSVTSDSGEWSVFLWGHVEPAYSGFP